MLQAPPHTIPCKKKNLSPSHSASRSALRPCTLAPLLTRLRTQPLLTILLHLLVSCYTPHPPVARWDGKTTCARSRCSTAVSCSSLSLTHCSLSSSSPVSSYPEATHSRRDAQTTMQQVRTEGDGHGMCCTCVPLPLPCRHVVCEWPGPTMRKATQALDRQPRTRNGTAPHCVYSWKKNTHAECETRSHARQAQLEENNDIRMRSYICILWMAKSRRRQDKHAHQQRNLLHFVGGHDRTRTATGRMSIAETQRGPASASLFFGKAITETNWQVTIFPWRSQDHVGICGSSVGAAWLWLAALVTSSTEHDRSRLQLHWDRSGE